MKKDFMRWAVGLLAGGALVVAGCGGSGNKSGEGERETGAFRTPTQERQQPPSDDEAKPLARERPSHPATGDLDAAGGNLPRGTPLGGGTAGPNTSKRQSAAGLLPTGVGTGLGANLADVYQAPQPQGDAAMGGGGAAGQSQAGSAAPSGPAGSGTAAGGSAGGGGAGGGGAGGGAGGAGAGSGGAEGAGGAGATSDDGKIEGGSGGDQGGQ